MVRPIFVLLQVSQRHTVPQQAKLSNVENSAHAAQRTLQLHSHQPLICTTLRKQCIVGPFLRSRVQTEKTLSKLRLLSGQKANQFPVRLSLRLARSCSSACLPMELVFMNFSNCFSPIWATRGFGPDVKR